MEKGRGGMIESLKRKIQECEKYTNNAVNNCDESDYTYYAMRLEILNEMLEEFSHEQEK